MRLIGFSTGALAYGDFKRGTALVPAACEAIELSALREPELEPLVAGFSDLPLARFKYISVHIPSRIPPDNEQRTVHLLKRFPRRFPLILHPNAVSNHELWQEFGDQLCVENMDNRKPIARTSAELGDVFHNLPNASFCFDLGHARQVDPTMTEAALILSTFGRRLKQIHISEVNTQSKHDPLTSTAVIAFQKVAHLIPQTVPVILETPASPNELDIEIEYALRALTPHVVERFVAD